MKYQVTFSKSARKAFNRLPSIVKKKLQTRIDALETEPIPNNAKAMVGYENIYRIRFSEWRVVYCVKDEKLTVMVVRVGNRSEVYEHLPSSTKL